MNKTKTILLVLALLLTAVSCKKSETDLGVNLQDPNTLYQGQKVEARFKAFTVVDDSLKTSNYSQGIFGNAQFPTLGSVEAVIYSQIAIASSTGIALSDTIAIDSVVMTLVVDTVYPVRPDSTRVNLHVKVMQLADTLSSTKGYYVFDQIPESSNCLFDSTVAYIYGTDSIRLKMRSSIYPVLTQTCSTEDFLNIVKGFSLRMDAETQSLVSVNFAATNTRLTLHYHNGREPMTYTFLINDMGACRFMNYTHQFTGTPLQPLQQTPPDSVAGDSRLYLVPMGGSRVRLYLQEFLDTFAVNHPTAVIHHAQLLLPLAGEGDTSTPKRIMAYKYLQDGTLTVITDAYYPYTINGYDGLRHRSDGYYRLRVTQHLQELLRAGKDYGTELVIDARRATPFPVTLNGTATASPARIEIIFSE